MFELILVAKALGIINQYFNEEVSEQDFWSVPKEWYQHQELEKKNLWFTIDPKKLKEQYKNSTEILVVTEEEKNSLIKTFFLLHKYSECLYNDAHLSERLLIAKNYLPPVFFETPTEHNKPNNKIRKIIPLFKNN